MIWPFRKTRDVTEVFFVEHKRATDWLFPLWFMDAAHWDRPSAWATYTEAIEEATR